MTITLELRPEETIALTERAAAEGVSVEAVLHGLVAGITPSSSGAPKLTDKQKAAVALLDSWLAERETLTPQQCVANDREFEELKANINRWRAEEGRPPAFP